MKPQASLPVIGIIGGDKRQEYLAEILEKYHISVMTYAVSGTSSYPAGSLRELMECCTVIVFPVPFTRDGKTISSLTKQPDLEISSVLFYLRPEHRICGGNIPEAVRTQCESGQIPYSDFLKNDRIALLNAIATAEGAIMEACRLSPLNFHQNRSVVIGYGKCGSVLADRLKGLHSIVSVCARSEKARTEAGVLGFDTTDVEHLDKILPDTFFVFNTVPAPVLSESLIQLLPAQAVIVDIASAPGGTDFGAAAACGITSSLFLSIPGKTAPYASAQILAGELLSLLDKS